MGVLGRSGGWLRDWGDITALMRETQIINIIIAEELRRVATMQHIVIHVGLMTVLLLRKSFTGDLGARRDLHV